MNKTEMAKFLRKRYESTIAQSLMDEDLRLGYIMGLRSAASVLDTKLGNRLTDELAAYIKSKFEIRGESKTK